MTKMVNSLFQMGRILTENRLVWPAFSGLECMPFSIQAVAAFLICRAYDAPGCFRLFLVFGLADGFISSLAGPIAWNHLHDLPISFFLLIYVFFSLLPYKKD
jgi:hypothetical protein